MDEEIKRYQGYGFTILFKTKRCIGAGDCVRNLPKVFDSSRSPWIDPGAASFEKIKETIQLCPTGALCWESETRVCEDKPSKNIITMIENGPLYARGDIDLLDDNGNHVESGYRIALCKCGRSSNKPFCDNSHKEAPDWKNNEDISSPHKGETSILSTDKLAITISNNGPYIIKGELEIRDRNGHDIFKGKRASLCSCGRSKKKPFCDGSHLV